MPLKPMSPMSQLSPAAADLGLGDMLKQQTQGETEEMRRKRMREQQQQQGVSPATRDLLGGFAGMGGFGGVSGPSY